MIEAEYYHKENLDKPVRIISTIDNPVDFPYDEFYALEKEELGHDIPSSKARLCTDWKLCFNKGEENWIGFVSLIGDKVAGVAYVWTRNLSESEEDNIFTISDNKVTLAPIAQAVQNIFPVTGKIFELEIGGIIVSPEYRRKGVAKKLFNVAVDTVQKGILSGSLQVLQNGSSVSHEELFFTLSSTGNYMSDDLSRLRELGVATNEEIEHLGINPNLIAVPRPLSVGSSHLAEDVGMNLVGISSNDFGQVYVQKFLNINNAL